MTTDRIPPGDRDEVAHQLGQLAATLDEVHAAVRAGEPGAVVLPGWAVQNLRRRLNETRDPDATPQERADRRTALCGFLDAVLDDAAGTS